MWPRSVLLLVLALGGCASAPVRAPEPDFVVRRLERPLRDPYRRRTPPDLKPNPFGGDAPETALQPACRAPHGDLYDPWCGDEAPNNTKTPLDP